MGEEDGFVTIKGIASTPTADRVGDIVEPLGARFKTPMPLLWQHDHKQPVGQLTFAKPEKSGIPFEGRIPVVKEAGRLKDRIDEAIHSLKYGLVTAVSIGFNAVEGAIEALKGGGYRYKEWDWLELSLVTIPANSEAVIQAVKSIDQEHRAAFGDNGEEVVSGDAPAPAVQGKRVVSLKSHYRSTTK
jgi:HK97 family phage prohead protease